MQEYTQAKTSTPGRHFKQITHPMRQLIETWHRQRVPAREIAARLGVHRSTIYRELKRGRVVHKDSEWRLFETYSADRAADVHDCNANAKGPPLKIGCNRTLVDQFNELVLNHRLSLYAARQVLLKRGVAVNVCLRTLYNYVYRHGFPLRPNQLVQGPRSGTAAAASGNGSPTTTCSAPASRIAPPTLTNGVKSDTRRWTPWSGLPVPRASCSSSPRG